MEDILEEVRYSSCCLQLQGRISQSHGEGISGGGTSKSKGMDAQGRQHTEETGQFRREGSRAVKVQLERWTVAHGAERPWRVRSSRDTIGLAFSRDPHWHTGGEWMETPQAATGGIHRRGG